jgi:general secretion pathway protein J
MQLAFAQLQSDCEHAADASMLGRRPFLLQADNRITLVRTVFNENEPARLQVIAYRLVDGKLLRRESVSTRDLTELDALWQAAIGDLDPTAPVTLQAGVDGMGVLVWQNNAWRKGPEVNPQGGTVAGTVSGLQVVLTVRNFPQPLTKSFLLGSI